jgi:heme-degrading monooxygenase HmoA
MKLLLGGPLAGQRLDDSFTDKYYSVAPAEGAPEVTVYMVQPDATAYRYVGQFESKDAFEAWRLKKAGYRTMPKK